MSTVLGITGGIATGKSTAMAYFEQKGLPVIYADQGARKVVEPKSRGLKKIEEVFGSEVLSPDGTLNRKKLGEIIFSDPEKREQLNQILRKDIRAWIEKEIQDHKATQANLIVVEIPLLYEENYEEMVDQVMVIYTNEDSQKERLMKRNQLTEKEAMERIRSQWPIDQKRKLADVVIDNQQTVKETYEQLEDWFQRFTHQTNNKK